MVKMKKQHILKKRTIVVIVILLAAILAASGYILYKAYQESSSKTSAPLTADEKTSEILNDDSISDKTAQAELKKLADNESDSSKKATYLLGLATSYTNSDNYTAALDFAKSAEVSNQNALSAAAVADAYAGSGNYQEAAKYYEQAAQRSEKSASRSERSPYNDYLNLKEDMESRIK